MTDEPPATPFPDAPTAEAVEAARRLFAGECRFMMGCARVDQLPPPDLPEVAFAGRSNVGKSSLVNALTGRKTLARTSNTPGRTREVNFFELAGRLRLVDLPGYGFAKAPKTVVEGWTGLMQDYVRGRAVLRLVCLLVDARHGLKPADAGLMDLMDRAGVAYRVVLTKADKPKAAAVEKVRAAVEAAIATRAAAAPGVLATSAVKGWGLAELRAHLAVPAEAEPGAPPASGD